MKKITKLTEAQKARFPEFVEKWTKIGLCTDPADFEAATTAALKAYKLCNLDRPMVVLRLASPYAASVGGAFAWCLLKEFFCKQVGQQVWQQVWQQVEQQVGQQVEQQVEQQVWQQVGQQVEQQVWQQVEQQVGQQVWQQVRQQVEQQVEQQVGQQVRQQVGQQVWQQVEQQVGQQVEQQVEQQVWQQVRQQVGQQVGQQSFQAAKDGFDNYGINSLWSSWGAYITFLRDACGWKDEILERFEIDEALMKSCGWTWWHQNVLAISDRPEWIKRDDAGRLHSQNSHAIHYRDGWGFSCWHGVTIPDEWLTKENGLTPETALTWKNIEQRRAACEILGWANILKSLDASIVDKNESEYIGTLYEANLPDSGKERFLQVKCGTGRVFCIPVPREVQTSIQASAWTYGIDGDAPNYPPEIRT